MGRALSPPKRSLGSSARSCPPCAGSECARAHPAEDDGEGDAGEARSADAGEAPRERARAVPDRPGMHGPAATREEIHCPSETSKPIYSSQWILSVFGKYLLGRNCCPFALTIERVGSSW